ncbi:MAG TPA: hypothetical protein VGR90_06115 [Acidimicrobiales bacterium]|nr:hypothetical protein [Acidimicrobiales bacterium]
MGPFSGISRRITAGFGIGFAVFLAAALGAAWGRPGTDSTDTQVEVFIIGHYHGLQASLGLGALAVLLFALFASGLTTHLLRADDATGDSWAPGFAIGAAGFLTLWTAALAVQGAYQGLAHNGQLPPLILELFRVANTLASGGGLFLGALLTAAGVSGLLNGTIPVPLAALGLVDAVVALASVGGLATARSTFGTLQIVALVVLAVWALLVSVWLIVTPADDSVPIPE